MAPAKATFDNTTLESMYSNCSSTRAQPRSDALPLVFEQNRGQVPDEYAFLGRGTGFAAYISAHGATFVCERSNQSPNGLDASQECGSSRDIFEFKLLGAQPGVRPTSVADAVGKANYFIGNDPSKWIRDIAMSTQIAVHDLYPGIDLIYYGNHGMLEYDFVVRPGADPNAIGFAYSGNANIRVSDDGDLLISTSRGGYIQRKPSVYQIDESGSTRRVPCFYKADTGGVVRFQIGAFDEMRPLVIDPVLAFSSYFGGAHGPEGVTSDGFSQVAVDSDGTIVVAGTTFASEIPITQPTFDSTSGGGEDVMVTRFSADGSTLLFSTFLGGTATDIVKSIALGSNGQVFVTGITLSADFFTTDGAFDRVKGDGTDSFLVKLNTTLATVDFSTFLSGPASQSVADIALANDNSIFAVGSTASTNFPTTQGAYDTSKTTSDRDLVVVRLNSTGTALLSASYLGGLGIEDARAIALDPSGSIWIAGTSDGVDYPTTVGAPFPTNSGFTDGVVSVMDGSLGSLTYSTYLGGALIEQIGDIRVVESGKAVVVGDTSSPNFPVTSGAVQTQYAGGGDVFMTEIQATAFTPVLYSTFLGGTLTDLANAAIVDESGAVVICGTTSSTDFPTTAGTYDTTLNGIQDIYVVRLQIVAGAGIDFSTLLGGSNSESSPSIALTNTGRIVVGCSTLSGDLATTSGTFDPTFNGGPDAYLCELSADATSLVFATYFGGSRVPADERTCFIASDSDGSFVIGGSTVSVDLPISLGTYDTTPNGGDDLFVARFDSTGTTLLFSTYVGGSLGDVCGNLTVDQYGSAVIVGYSESSDFPTTQGAIDTTNLSGTNDVVVTKLTPAGNGLSYSTYFGGSSGEIARTVAVDLNGVIFIGGDTESPDFPTTAGAPDSAFGGFNEAFVASIVPTAGVPVRYSTFLGGSSAEYCRALAVRPDGEVVATGETGSPEFPTTPGVIDTSYGGFNDVFVTRLNATGTGIIFSTFIGAAGFEGAYGLSLSQDGSITIAGVTRDQNYPTTPGAFDTVGSSIKLKAFTTRINSTGTTLMASTLFGGTGDSDARGVRLDSNNNVVVLGLATSEDVPTTLDALSQSPLGNRDIFVAIFDPSLSTLIYGTYFGTYGLDNPGSLDVGPGGIFFSGIVGGGNMSIANSFQSENAGSADAFFAKLDIEFPGADTVGLYSSTGACFQRWSLAGGNADAAFAYGSANWIGLSGDWDGDGTDSIGAFDPETNAFFLKNTNSSGASDQTFVFGAPGDLPVVGDWDGNGTTTVGVYRPSVSRFFLKNSNGPGGADVIVTFGAPGSGFEPIVGDWNGDGITTIGLYQRPSGGWFIRNSNSDGAADIVVVYGPGGTDWDPIVGNWDGIGGDSIGLYQHSTSYFWLRNSITPGPANRAFQFGVVGTYRAIAGNWSRL